MNAYKTAFEGLAKLIKMKDDEDMIRLVEELERDLSDTVTVEQEQLDNFITEEEWNAFKYTDKVKLLEDNPTAYQNAVNGKFREAV